MAHTFDGLLRANLDQLSAAERNTANICEDVVGDNQADWQEEPDHALEDIVHDEVRLHNDEVESHVSPSELGKLELVVALLERTYEEDEALNMLAIVAIFPTCLARCRTYP
jgi:hypothetical protein